MMRLTESAVSEIRACQEVYTQSSVARAYGVHRSTVNRIWHGKHHVNVPAAPEPPNIEASKTADIVKDDVMILANRGMRPNEIAEALNVSLVTVYRCFPRWYFG